MKFKVITKFVLRYEILSNSLFKEKKQSGKKKKIQNFAE